MENKIDLNRIRELLLKGCGLDKNSLWENSEEFKIMKIEMKDELDTFTKNPLTKEISYKDRQSYMNNSFMYKIMENQEMMSKEKFLSLFKEEGEIFEQIVEEINLINPDIVFFTGDLIDKDFTTTDKDKDDLIEELNNINKNN